jgi:hypothetical protein
VIIDCQSCPVRDLHCSDCMVTTLLMPSSDELPLDGPERAAVARFVEAGLLSALEATSVQAQRQPWEVHRRAVG